MKISCLNTGKRFDRDWIFRNFSKEFTAGRSYAITGPNGSGKSTLLQVIAGAVMTSEGKIEYHLGDKAIDPESAYRHLSIVAPYLELIEEMTLLEFLTFHRTFKPPLPGADLKGILARLGLEAAKNKQIRFFSSGMKQRVKLAQAFFSDTSCLLLDEPCTNLDEAGIRLYHELINEFSHNRLIIVSSNDEVEYSFCEEVVSVVEYK